jgi:hypothetical protein
LNTVLVGAPCVTKISLRVTFSEVTTSVAPAGIAAASVVLGRAARDHLGLAVQRVPAEHALVDHGDAIGALLGQVHIEGRAEFADEMVLDLAVGAVGLGHRGHDAQRLMIEEEQVVRHRRVDGHPIVGTRDGSRGGQHPHAVGERGGGSDRGDGGDGDQRLA